MSTPRLELVPLDQETAFAFIRQHHRHHLPPPGDILRVGVACSGPAGRRGDLGPADRARARRRVHGRADSRCCTDGTPNAASMLYGAVARMAFAAGYRKVVTYILASETGHSARAAGWRVVAEVRGRSWSCPSRPRVDRHPTQDKLRLEVSA